MNLEMELAAEDPELERAKLRLCYLMTVDAFLKLHRRMPDALEQAEIAAALLTARRVAAARDRCHWHALQMAAGCRVLQ